MGSIDYYLLCMEESRLLLLKCNLCSWVIEDSCTTRSHRFEQGLILLQFPAFHGVQYITESTPVLCPFLEYF